MTEIKHELSDDRRSVRVEISGDLSTTAVERHISALARIRNDMLPAVPMHPPTTKDFAGDPPHGAAHYNPEMEIRLIAPGVFRLWLRSTGLGWLSFDLPADSAVALGEYLVLNIQNDNFVSIQQFGEPDGVH